MQKEFGIKNKTKSETATETPADPGRFSERGFVAEVKRLIEPLCEAEGIELVHVEYQRESFGRVLRLYIDKPNGVTLDDCVDISRRAGDLIDVYLDAEGGAPNKPGYRLEVSSPGVERPIGKLSDFDRFKGRAVKMKIKPAGWEAEYPKNQKLKTIRGVIEGVLGDTVKIRTAQDVRDIPYETIARANIANCNGDVTC